jgi:DNA modification methylase
MRRKIAKQMSASMPGCEEIGVAVGQIEYLAVRDIKPYPGNPRTHNERQIAVLMASIREFGFRNPILVDADNVVVAGAGRLEAAERHGLTQVPVLRIGDLSADQIRAYRLTDNRTAELAGWDTDILAIELQHLTDIEIDFPIEVMGWSTAEIDLLLDGASPGEDDVAADSVPPVEDIAVSRPGDLWLLGHHRVLCGSALEPASYERLMQGKKADFVCQDPPWNIKVSTISGSGRIKHREFMMASGEMTDPQFREFLERDLARNHDHARPGAVVQVFIDWRGVEKVITAGTAIGLELFNICVWSKGHGGMGSPWRSAHEMVVVFKRPGAPIKDRVNLGRDGRVRCNVWTVPGQNSFGAGRMEALRMHPTSKPVGLLADAIRDVTDRGDIVLDSFLGSGSLLIAAEKTGRILRGMELDPLYVDTVVRRWEKFTGRETLLEGDGRSFADIAAAREEPESEPAKAPVRTHVRAMDKGSGQ